MSVSLESPRNTGPSRSVYFQFVLVGVVTSLLGPILPSLAALWVLPDSKLGAFFTAQFLGGMVGSLLSGTLVPRLGYPRLIALGLFAMAIGVGTLTLADWTFGLAAVFLYGLGTGFAIPASNTWVAESSKGNSASALNILNLAWGVGATIWPLIAAAGLRRFSLQQLLLVIAFAVAVMGFTLAITTGQTRSGSSSKDLSDRNALHPTIVVVFAALVFLYVGTETSVGGWIASYGKRMLSPQNTTSAALPSFFWASLLAGRATAPLFLRYWSEKQVQRTGLATAIIGTVLLISETPALLVPAAVLAGFGLAPVFPIIVSWMSHQLGSSRPKLTGVLFSISGLGGAVIPWLVGMTSSHMGSLRIGLSLTLVGALGLLMLSWIFASRLSARRS